MSPFYYKYFLHFTDPYLCLFPNELHGFRAFVVQSALYSLSYRHISLFSLERELTYFWLILWPLRWFSVSHHVLWSSFTNCSARKLPYILTGEKKIEQILKICLQFWITPYMIKTWKSNHAKQVWVCSIFSAYLIIFRTFK